MRKAHGVFKDGAEGMQRFVDFMRTFVDLKLMYIQFNTVSSDTLRAAQKEPEEIRDLVVEWQDTARSLWNLMGA